MIILIVARGWRARINRPSWRGRLIAALIMAGILICLTDVLAAAAQNAVARNDSGWWGAQHISPWQESGAAVSEFQPTSLELAIAISDGELTARYTLMESSGTALVKQALAAQSAETGNLMVDNLLGQVSVAEYHYGLTGNHHVWSDLEFEPPQLQVSGDKTVVTISSSPFRLALDQQYIYVATPSGIRDGSPEDLQIKGSSAVQVLDVSGARLVSVAKDDAELLRRSSAVAAEAIVREPGQSWVTGLRTAGGITIPIVGGLLARLDSMFVYIILTWSLAEAAKVWTHNKVLAVGRNAASTIVGALAAMAVLSFCYQLILEFISDPRQRAPAVAGPIGLLIGGVVLMWPAACWRVTSSGQDSRHTAEAGLRGEPPGQRARRTPRTDPRRASGRSSQGSRRPAGSAASKHGWRRLFVVAVAAVPYLLALYFWLGINPLTTWQVVPSAAGIVVLVHLLVNAVLIRNDRERPVPLAISVGMLAAILAATVIWPVLFYTGFWFPGAILHVNVLGKWMYFAAGIITAIGLCILAIRVIGVVADSRICRLKQAAGADDSTAVSRSTNLSIKMVRWGQGVASVTLTAGALAAILPSLAAQAQVGDSHATGMVPAELTFFSSGLYRALPQLLNWLLLGLAVVVLLSISRELGAKCEIAEPKSRIAVRRIAIPVMALLIYSVYSGGTWLYVPITLIGGLMILARLVLPKKVATESQALAPSQAIQSTLTAWRRADFADGQRQKLIGDSDDIRKALIKDGMTGYERTLDALDSAQTGLAERRDHLQQDARGYIKKAFDHRGETPEVRIAWRGAVIGALLGLVPAAVFLLFVPPPPSWSGYPVLDFLGYTGWILFMWPALGWSIGYFLPYIQGGNGIEKALWVFAAAIASIPINLLWLDGHQWATALIYYLELFSFLLLISVILCDLLTLKATGMPPVSSWIQMHNWRFIVTWSTALVAAISTAAVTFVSTTVTDLSQQTISTVTGQTSAQSQTSVPEQHS